MNETLLVYREKDPVQDADLIRREEISTVAWQQNWECCDIQKRDENNPFTITWMTRDEKTSIQYLENHIVDIPYVMIEGENQEQIAEVLRKSLDFYHIDELYDRLNSNLEDQEILRAINLFGSALSGKFNADYFGVFERYLSHPSPDVRKATMFAAAAPSWAEFRPLFEKTRLNDPDLTVREYARVTLENMHAND
jgi:hypothetical protein